MFMHARIPPCSLTQYYVAQGHIHVSPVEAGKCSLGSNSRSKQACKMLSKNASGDILC